MDQTLLTVMTVFVAVAAIAMIVQMGLLFGIYKSSRAMQESVQRVMPKVENLLDVSKKTVEESRVQILDITTKTSEILDTTKKQMQRIDEVLEDAAARAKVQLDRAELVLDDAMGRAQETVAIVQTGIIRPVREIHAVAAGIRTAFNVLLRGRPNPSEATADEEMFI
jgi:hypothetical protein